MTEWRLFEEGTIPEWTTPGWYAGRETAPHLEQEGHRERLVVTAELALDARMRGARTLSDLGAGDGGLMSLVAHAYGNVWGYDLQTSNVEAAKTRGVQVELKDVVTDRWVWFGECVVAAELLEHLVDPHALVRRIAASTDARFLVASSPYTETDESHYDFHCWAWDLEGYRRLLQDNGWRVLRQETAWICQVLLAEKA